MANLITGKPDTSPSKPSHIRGIRRGNETGSLKKQDGLYARGAGAVASARRSTGIRPGDREPIDSRMPNLTPP